MIPIPNTDTLRVSYVGLWEGRELSGRAHRRQLRRWHPCPLSHGWLGQGVGRTGDLVLRGLKYPHIG